MKTKQKAILQYLKEHAYLTCRRASGKMRYPYIEPGANYINTLWDWDALFALEALIDITEKLKADGDFDYENRKKIVIECGKGCVLNFLDCQLDNGFIPINLPADGESRAQAFSEVIVGRKENQIKPVLAQYVEKVSKYCGDYSWFNVEKMQKYYEYYDKNQFDERTGLYVWENDLRIGIDNNPTVFFRPRKSSADIYLNTFMYMEFCAFSRVLEKLGEYPLSAVFAQKAENLKTVINEECYDVRDAFYYSQDVLYDDTVLQRGFHVGYPRDYKGLPIKIRCWAGLLPLWAGIATQEQAEQIVVKNFNDDSLFCKAGIRSLAKNEKMFSEKATNNPSNHLGPVWTINNVLVWKGLKRYGFTKIAEELRKRTIDLLGDSVLNDGGFYESYEGNGKPMLFLGFLSWNCLVSEMLDAE